MRPAALADDFTGTAAVIAHALEASQQAGYVFEHACCLYATAPLLQVRFLRQGLELLEAMLKSPLRFRSASSASRSSAP